MSRLPSEYSIQEASAKLGVPVQKLRRWDSQGVLVARRTDGGHRRYAREIIDGLAGSALGILGIRALLSVNTANLPRVGRDGDLVTADWRARPWEFLPTSTKTNSRPHARHCVRSAASSSSCWKAKAAIAIW